MALSKPTYQQTQKYPAWMDREAIYLTHQGGVYDSGAGTDFKVSAQGPVAMAVNIAIGRALVPQRALPPVGERAGLWGTYNDAITSRTVLNNSSGNPRIDQVLLVQNDSSTGSPGDTTDIVIVPGNAAVGATLDNRTGALTDALLTTTYRNWTRLADLLVTNGATSVSASQIRDRRVMADKRYTNRWYMNDGVNFFSVGNSSVWNALGITPTIGVAGGITAFFEINTGPTPETWEFSVQQKVRGDVGSASTQPQIRLLATPAGGADAVTAESSWENVPPSTSAWRTLTARGAPVLAANTYYAIRAQYGNIVTGTNGGTWSANPAESNIIIRRITS